jgi:hypothetical protein
LGKYVPLFHFGCRDINTIRLTTAPHGEVNVERGKTLSDITLRDHVERGRMIKDVIIQREFTTVMKNDGIGPFLDIDIYLGMKSTPLEFTLDQLAFFTSAATFVRSSEDILPAQ